MIMLVLHKNAVIFLIFISNFALKVVKKLVTTLPMSDLRRQTSIEASRLPVPACGQHQCTTPNIKAMKNAALLKDKGDKRNQPKPDICFETWDWL